MANISEVRHTIVFLDPPVEGEVVKTKDEPDPDTIVDEEDWTFDDEDFWTAIDLMETTAKILNRVLKMRGLSARNRAVIENHRDDLVQFVGEFPFPAGDEEEEGQS